MSVSPNPASNELNVSLDEGDNPSQQALREAVEITMFNSQQEKVYTIKTTNVKIKIPVGSLPEGIYLLNVLNKEGTIQRRVLINR